MILVTGATGFVGRRVVEAFASSGHPVRALVRTPFRGSVLATPDVEIFHGDMLNPDSLRQACQGVDTVVHLAAVLREHGYNTYQRVNYEGTRSLLDAAASAEVKRVLHASAIGASSDPAFGYLYSRWMAEEEVNRSPIPHNIVRFSVGFGQGDAFFNVMAAQVKLSPFVPVAGDGRARFQPIAVEDVAKCLLVAYEKEQSVETPVEVGGPEHFTYDEMLDLVADTLGARIIEVHIPAAVLAPGVAIMEALVPRPPVIPEELKMLPLGNTTQLDSVERAFGFTPRGLKGNIGYISKMGLWDALKINLGFMPGHIRDH